MDSSTRIKLWLASGESVMPNLTGLSHEAAEEKLTALGFTNVTFGPADDDHDDWVVTGQSVLAGTPRERSDAIAVTLGGDPDQLEAVDVVARSLDRTLGSWPYPLTGLAGGHQG